MNSNTLTEILGTFILGMFGTAVIGAIVIPIILLCRHPAVLPWTIGSVIVIYMVGWCTEHMDNFMSEFRAGTPVEKIPEYGVPVLDKLQQLEAKHKMSTLKFMSYVNDNHIPYGVDNLDYLEWISLVVELALLNHKNEQEKQ